MISKFVVGLALVALACAQDFEYEAQAPRRPAPARINPGYSGPAAPKPTPVAILKQINRHNDDGSYTYGYESADGSFKIETKLPTGEVKGKYGFVDDTGKVRVVEYGATKYGFEPSGEGITVAPPTLVDETTNKDGTLNPEYADQYYEPAPPLRQAPRPRPQPRPQPSYESYEAPAPQRSPVPSRLQVPGASLSTDINYIPQGRPAPARSFQPDPAPAPVPYRAAQQFSFAPAPAPIEEESYEPRPAPRVTYARPAPAPARAAPVSFAPQYEQAAAPPQFAPAPRPAPVARQSGGILDQLAKDYALPQGSGSALHDISFGYY